MAPHRGFLWTVVLLAFSFVKYEALEFWLQEATNTESIHKMVKRATDFSNTTTTEYLVVIQFNDIASFRRFLENVSLPYMVNGSVQISDITTTTVCSPSNLTDYECRCESGYSWPKEVCSSYNACDTTVQDSCGCITSIPADGHSCQLATEYDLSVTVSVSDGEQTQITLEIIRHILRTLSYPYQVSSELQLLSVNITTVCSGDSNQTLCECEKHYSWPCEKCYNNSLCPETEINSTCDTVYGLPINDQYCKPFTTPCLPCSTTTTPPPSTTTTIATTTTPPPSTTTTMSTTTTTPPPSAATTTTPPPTTTTTPPSTTTTTISITTPTTTTPLTTPPPPPAEYDISGTVSLSNLPEEQIKNILNEIRRLLRSVPFPYTVSSELQVSSVNITTVCSGDSNQMQCVCEKHYSWPCQKCYNYSLCPETEINSTCDTVYGLPIDDQYCQPFTMPCLPCQTTTTMSTTTTTPNTPPPPPPASEENLSVTLDVEYDNSFNDPSNQMYKDTERLIEDGCKKTLDQCTVVGLRFRPGSTIVESNISRISPSVDIKVVKLNVINEMIKIFNIITDGKALDFQKKPVLFGREAELACEPDAGFNTTWTATWFRDGINITDQHTVVKTGGNSILKIEKFYTTDKGYYECRLTSGSNIFRQKSTKQLTFESLPDIRFSATLQTKVCRVGFSEFIECSVQNIYRVSLTREGEHSTAVGKTNTTVRITECPASFTLICEATDYPMFVKNLRLDFTQPTEVFDCKHVVWGLGNEGDQTTGNCEDGKVGEKVATCQLSSTFHDWEVEDNCVIKVIQELLDQTLDLVNPTQVPDILTNLNNATNELRDNVTESSATIEAIVSIMEILANISGDVSDRSMTEILNISSILTLDDAKSSWETLNKKAYRPPKRRTRSIVSRNAASSRFLNNLESYTEKFQNEIGNITVDFIVFNKTVFSNAFQEEYDGSVGIDIPDTGLQNNSISVLTFESLHNVLPSINRNSISSLTINARVALVQSKGVKNVSFTFDLRNESLFSPLCVFWNFSLSNNSGGWDDKGCTLVNITSSTVICQCNHLTSFSVLMSPYANFTKTQQLILDIITYIGVAISIASLLICLIIEAIVWKKIRKPNVSYMRHVTIVNIAVSLLFADIWFMIGAGISEAKHRPSCTAATFFVHLFYLALFFWMLVSGLLLFYRTINVFGSMRKRTMLAIGFTIGYGSPIIIAVVTIASTAGHNAYTQINNVCWLNWDQSKALLAFVIPALTIVMINFLILLVVLYKILRRRTSATGADSEERHVMVVIIRCLAFLTPIFGLTWCLGVATMVDIEDDNSRFGVHVAFAFFNSLQGFFILLFGTLLDNKVRKEITAKSLTSGATRSTSGGQTGSSSGLFSRVRRGYNLSSNGDSSVTNT